MISTLYKKYFISSGLICSWPEAPTLDEIERYRGLSLKSQDMLDESYFRMPEVPTPTSSGFAPIFAKNIVYSKKKDNFTRKKDTFDSNKNMFLYFIIIHYLKNDIVDDMNFKAYAIEESNNNEDNIENDNESIITKNDCNTETIKTKPAAITNPSPKRKSKNNKI